MKQLINIFLKLIAISALIISTSSSFAGDNGTIIFAPVNANGDPTAVPTLSSYMLIILSVLLFIVAFRVSKQKGAGKFFALILGASVLMASTGGVKLVTDLQASSFFTITPAAGDTFSISQFGPNEYLNSSGVPQGVTQLMLPTVCPGFPGNSLVPCTSETILENGSSCQVNCDIINPASDVRLKHSINPLTKLDSDIQIYSFKYNEGNGDTFVGVMAQDLLEDDRYKHAVKKMPNDYYGVNYQSLGLKMIKLEQWQESPTNIFDR